MKFTKRIAFILFLVVYLWFALANWSAHVTIDWIDSQEIDINLSLFVLIVLLCGAFPVWLLSAFSQWQLKRQITKLERALKAKETALLSYTNPIAEQGNSHILDEALAAHARAARYQTALDDMPPLAHKIAVPPT